MIFDDDGEDDDDDDDGGGGGDGLTEISVPKNALFFCHSVSTFLRAWNNWKSRVVWQMKISFFKHLNVRNKPNIYILLITVILSSPDPNVLWPHLRFDVGLEADVK